MYSVKLVEQLKKYDFIVIDGEKFMVDVYCPKAGEMHRDFGNPGTLYGWVYGERKSLELYGEYPVVYL